MRTKPLFVEDFESGLDQWKVVRNGEGTVNTDWHTYKLSAYSTNVALSMSYEELNETQNFGYDVDNWLISPMVTLNGTLTFKGLYIAMEPEQFELYVSTTSDDIGAFTKVCSWDSTNDLTSNMNSFSFDLSGYAGAQGYIAFRHKSVVNSWLIIDNIGISKGNLAWSTHKTANTLRVTGLQPATEYEFQAQSVAYLTLSEWSEVFTFTTNRISNIK